MPDTVLRFLVFVGFVTFMFLLMFVDSCLFSPGGPDLEILVHLVVFLFTASWVLRKLG